jgi:hypothetical protein
MVSADNVHADVLALVFEHLAGTDVVSAAAVSHAFHAAAVPRLYAALHSRVRQAKRVPPVRRINAYDRRRELTAVCRSSRRLRSYSPTRATSPTSARSVRAPHYACPTLHPRVAYMTEIRRLPPLNHPPSPDFLLDALAVLREAAGLRRFSWMAVPDTLPAFLAALPAHAELRTLRLAVPLTSRAHAELLIPVLGRLEHVHLEHASACVLDILPRWAGALSPTLTMLSLYACLHLSPRDRY